MDWLLWFDAAIFFLGPPGTTPAATELCACWRAPNGGYPSSGTHRRSCGGTWTRSTCATSSSAASGSSDRLLRAGEAVSLAGILRERGWDRVSSSFLKPSVRRERLPHVPLRRRSAAAHQGRSGRRILTSPRARSFSPSSRRFRRKANGRSSSSAARSATPCERSPRPATTGSSRSTAARSYRSSRRRACSPTRRRVLEACVAVGLRPDRWVCAAGTSSSRWRQSSWSPTSMSAAGPGARAERYVALRRAPPRGARPGATS